MKTIDGSNLPFSNAEYVIFHAVDPFIELQMTDVCMYVLPFINANRSISVWKIDYTALCRIRIMFMRLYVSLQLRMWNHNAGKREESASGKRGKERSVGEEGGYIY